MAEMKSQRIIGKTSAAGFQIGVRRTLSISAEEAWRLLTSPHCLSIWLGVLEPRGLVEGASFRLSDETSVEVRLVKPGSHLRLGWQPPGWRRSSTIQVRVLPKGVRCVLAFHQEQLPGAKQRVERGAFFRTVLGQLEQLASPG
jgi:uncharacterized protein YndB with AHSA1/START domain